jgi:actin-related protein
LLNYFIKIISKMEADPVVIDCGTGRCKAGLGGEDAPRTSFPTIVGYDNSITIGMNKTKYVGEEA